MGRGKKSENEENILAKNQEEETKELTLVEKASLMLEEGLKDDIVRSFLGIVKLKDETTYNHSIGVARLVAHCIGDMEDRNECDWSDDEKLEIVKGALLHDVGKVYLSFGLQNSSIKLDVYTRAIINVHPIVGYIAIRDSGCSEIVKNIVLMHHARADGSGYPLNLESQVPYTEENTPSYVWLVAYADSFDAMTSQRHYKASKSYQEAWNTLNNLRRDGVLPYRYAGYMSTVVKELSLFGVDGLD